MYRTYTITASGVDDLSLFGHEDETSPAATLDYPIGPLSSDNGQKGTDYRSVTRAAPPAGPKPRLQKSRYDERETALRGLTVRCFVRDQYLAAKRLSVSTVAICNDLLGHLARCRGETLVRDLGDKLLFSLRDYFLGLIADEDLGPATANKYLRQLKAIGNHAAKIRLLRTRLTFNAWLPEDKPKPKALTTEEYWRIGQAARAVNGLVANVPAGVWWYAWYLTMSRIGNRLTALMLAKRGDYKHGILWLRAENQKQGEDQRLALPDYCHAAIEDLLAAHDGERLFPWPWDVPKPGKRSTWKVLFRRFRKILDAADIDLKPGVLTRVFRQTAATMVESLGGSGAKLCGHSSPAVTKKHYLDPSRGPITREALLIPADRPPQTQLNLFSREAS